MKLAEGEPYSCDQLRRALSGRAPKAPRPVQLGDDDVLRVLRQHEAEIADCRARQVRADPAVAGVMEVAFVVMPSGRPGQITVTSAKFQGTTFAKCVIQAVSAWRFPAFSGAPIPLSFPIGLEPQR